MVRHQMGMLLACCNPKAQVTLELQVVRHPVAAVVMVVVPVAVGPVARRHVTLTARSVPLVKGTILTFVLVLRVSHGRMHSTLCLTLR